MAGAAAAAAGAVAGAVTTGTAAKVDITVAGTGITTGARETTTTTTMETMQPAMMVQGKDAAAVQQQSQLQWQRFEGFNVPCLLLGRGFVSGCKHG